MNAKPVILVVDDDLPILTLMRNVLREFGFETREANTGEGALQAVREVRPDLVLLDKNMPGMSGGEVIDALRSEGGLKNVPVLILSGEPVDSEQIARLGAAGAVMKPFDITDLVERIRSHVGVPRASRG
ncbi:MAG TPA: response regulator [Thermoanaerobaculia bacterium]|nr:response regulator [Thermoanaerobaculia bacterium]